jgi:hypothetical protein
MGECHVHSHAGTVAGTSELKVRDRAPCGSGTEHAGEMSLDSNMVRRLVLEWLIAS